MIREAMFSDVPAIVRMGEKQLRSSHYSEFLAVNPAAMEALAVYLIEQDNGIILLEQDGPEPCGMIGIIATPHPYTHEIIMSEWFWYVEPGRRGRGVRLFRAAEEWAEGQGVKHIIMAAPNRKVADFYKRSGYSPFETHYIKTI